MSEIDTDPERPRGGPFAKSTGFTGQDYNRREEARLTANDPSGGAPGNPPENSGDIPPDNGERAHVEPSGEVRGAGVGIGGGSEGEDFDGDPGGDAPVITGAAPDKPAD